MHISRGQLVGAAAALAVVALAVYSLRPKPVDVDAVAVTRGPLETTVDADGRTRVRERYVVVAPVAGRVERITRVEGALVHAGDIVARLRPMPLDSTTAAQARARLDGAGALALQASAQTRVAAAELEQRRRELSRAKRLGEVGGVAPRVVEEAQLAELEAEEALRAADQRSRAADADVRQARAVLAALDQPAAMTVLVRSPADGRVLRVAERSERIVAAGTPLIEVGDPASLEIVIDVLSSDGSMIHPGDRVRLAEWSAGADVSERAAHLGGRVREIEPSGFTKVSALGVEEQRVNVIVDPDTIPAVIGDGFRVEASIIVWSSPDVLRVPRSALLRAASADGGSGAWTALVINAGRVESRAVRIGHGGGADAEVVAGVGPGESVIVFPSDQLKPGQRVRPRRG